MPPKDSKRLRDEVERANEKPAPEGQDYTAEGKQVPRPKRKDFFSNLEKVAKKASESDR